MGKQKIRPPSQVDSLTFPVFGLTWYGAPSSPTKNDGCSVIAYCGGGGSAKTGVGNKIVVLVTADDYNSSQSAAASAADSGVGEGDSSAAASQPSSSFSTFASRQVDISTGEALCFGIHAFRPYNDPLNMVRLLACVGDEILLYGIPLLASEANNTATASGGDDAIAANDAASNNNNDNGNDKDGAILLAKTNVGKGYGANVSTYSGLHQNGKFIHCIAVGCENGTVVNFHLNQTTPNNEQSFEFVKVSECKGHTKAICAVNFHPRGHQLLSSAKDGTARIFDAANGNPLGLLKCEVHDPNGPAPPAIPAANTGTMKTKDPRMMKRPPQILVRGCAYGDLEGKIIYTVASGKRGAAYLTKWRTLVPLNRPPPEAAGAGGPTTTTASLSSQPLSINQEYRIQCSPVPISATSLSSDGTLLTMGSVEGSLLLYNLESKKVLKEFKEVHDLPVTCVASRPVPNLLMLPGELEGGVNFDAVSASADNRLGRWTLQRKSRVKKLVPPRSARKRSGVEVYLWELLRIPLFMLFLLAVVAMRDTMDICREEFGLSALVMDAGVSNAGHCLYREVLWAEEGRVSFVPE
eukprot:CAMPEP_0172313064 /NCGR_PEP_ID=MMETSP1058-20130122/19273_1 /TAXON_ID=83371 /ORGANISM="Detonula confervacea, Strain CCMP 353" /LENGTH=579 /DNA_ID=CAMNT_0013026653 /DNA_START=176 /DNA_END=1915 /DNA_ORIENTATION=+